MFSRLHSVVPSSVMSWGGGNYVMYRRKLVQLRADVLEAFRQTSKG